MALTDESGSGMVMPVQPMGHSGSYMGGSGFGFGGDWAWIILLLVLCGGWNNGFGGGFGGGDLYPWLNNSQNINGGFRDQMLSSSLTGIQSAVTSGFGDVQTALCGGFAGVNASVAGAQNALAQQLYTNQIADLERSFGLQSQLAQCCCDNRLATAQTQALVQSENCADRYEAAQNTQAIISAITNGVQSIKDDLCADRLDAERRENANLRSELMYARGQASQIEQTAQIKAGQNATMNSLVNELRSCPIPSQPVYGSQPIFTCGNGCGTACGCGCN